MLHLLVILYEAKRGFGLFALNLRNPEINLAVKWLSFIVTLSLFCEQLTLLAAFSHTFSPESNAPPT